jgi:hypothetical protein
MPINRATLTVQQILGWADAHRARTGRWPNPNSGPVLDAPGETWAHIKQALVKGLRGWAGRGRPGTTTLAVFTAPGLLLVASSRRS